MTVIALSCQMVHLLAALLHPFMPGTARTICDQLGVKLTRETMLTMPQRFTATLKEGHALGTVCDLTLPAPL